MSCFRFISHLSDIPAKIFFSTGNILFFLFSVTGNSIVIFLVLRKPHLKTPTYCLLAALASSDFITATCGQLTYFVEVLFKTSTSCAIEKVNAFFNVSSCSTSILLLCAIAHDRYLRVSKGVEYENHTSMRRVLIISVSCAVFGMSMAVMFTFQHQYVVIASTLGFAILGTSCFIFICIHSRRIHRIVHNHIRVMERALQAPISSGSEDHGQRQTQYNARVEKAVNRSLFAVISLFFCAWSPVIILMLIFTAHNVQRIPLPESYRVAFIWCSSLSYINGALNPILYSYRCDAISKELKDLFRVVTCRKNEVLPIIDEGTRLQSSRPHRTSATLI